MSRYTTQLRTIIEHYSQDVPNLTHKERIEIGRKKLFNFDYPIFDINYKKVFETNFIRYYYNSEIGFETEGLFSFELETWLLHNMSYYNQLFESELLKFEPLDNVNIKEDYTLDKEMNKGENRDTNQISDMTQQTTKENNTVSNTDTSSTSLDDTFNRNIFSDTPQDRLSITTNDGNGTLDYATTLTEDKGKIENETQLDTRLTANATADSNEQAHATGNMTDTFKQNIDSVDKYLRNLKGKQGSQSYSQLLNEYRGTFLNIEKQIFLDMRKLFMLIY